MGSRIPKKKTGKNATDGTKKPKNSKKWTDEEEIRVLMYMRDFITQGLPIEKPNVNVFYERMIIALDLKDVTVGQLVYKVHKNLKHSYQEAQKWQNSTGAGVVDGSILQHLRRMCRFYDLLNEIYGAKVNVNPPYVYESSSLVEGAVAISYNDETDLLNDYDDIIVYDPEPIDIPTLNSPAISTSNQATSTSISEANSQTTGKTPTIYTVYTETIDVDLLNDVNGPSTSNQATSNIISEAKTQTRKGRTTTMGLDIDGKSGEPDTEDTVGRFKKSLSTIPTNKPSKPQTPSTATSIMSDWQLKRAEAIFDKNKMTAEKSEREDQWKYNQMKLEREKFDFEKQIRLKEFDKNKIIAEKNEREDQWKQNQMKLEQDKFDFEKHIRLKEWELKKEEMAKEERLALKKMEFDKEERMTKLKLEFDLKKEEKITQLKFEHALKRIGLKVGDEL